MGYKKAGFLKFPSKSKVFDSRLNSLHLQNRLTETKKQLKCFRKIKILIDIFDWDGVFCLWVPSMSATSADRIKNPSKFDDLMKNVEIIENLKFKIFDFLMFPEVRRELRRAPERVWLALVSEEGVVVSEQTKCFFHQNESSKLLLFWYTLISHISHLMSIWWRISMG